MPGPGRDRMLAAAAIIAREASRLASAWSVQIPPTMKVTATDSSARISSGVGPSYPNEVKGVRHPVYATGPRQRGPGGDPPGWHWVKNQYRPFLAPAAVAKADEATAEIAKFVDDFCVGLGFRRV